MSTLRPATSNVGLNRSGYSAITCSVWVPIEPVEPRIAIRFGCVVLFVSVEITVEKGKKDCGLNVMISVTFNLQIYEIPLDL